MEPDFYRQYKDLPVPELVKVARTPDDYLPEAVAAAKRILRERGITKEEMDTAEWAIAQNEMADAVRKSERFDLRAWIGGLFSGDRLTLPSERWLTVLLLLYGIYYCYNIYLEMRQLAWVMRCTDCVPNRASFIGLSLGIAIYMTICLYCLLKQKRMGWSLLLIQLVYMLVVKFAILFRLYAHHSIFFSPLFAFVIPIFINIGLGVILFRPYVLTTFNINAATKSRTLLAAALLGVVTLVSI